MMVLFSLLGMAFVAVLVVLGAFWLMENVSFKKDENDE